MNSLSAPGQNSLSAAEYSAAEYDNLKSAPVPGGPSTELAKGKELDWSSIAGLMPTGEKIVLPDWGSTSKAPAPGSTRFRPSVREGTPAKVLDRKLLNEAQQLIEDFNLHDNYEMTLQLVSLRRLILDLWESAVEATIYHQEILAALESAVRSVDSLNKDQISVFLEALKDLAGEKLTKTHVDVIQSRLIEMGFSPLAILSELEEFEDH